MNTKQIECILEVSKTLNFNRAAENLFISQPALSYLIHTAEKEIGFKIFNRSGKGTAMTFAGKDFVYSLEKIQKDLYKAIEHGQNMNRNYDDHITICVTNRSAVYYLPDAINEFSVKHPHVAVSPLFKYENQLDSFLNMESDILFSMDGEIKNIPNVITYPLFKSKIYAVVRKDDILAGKEIATVSDLDGRTLIVGGKAPKTLKALQRKLMANRRINYINSPDHATTLLNISSGRGICLAPGFLNDRNGEFLWIPFECEEHFDCTLSIHDYEKRKSVHAFIKLLQSYYQGSGEFL